jgi:lipopolysaccharide export system permease protein
MITLIDRQLVLSFLKAFIVCLTSLLTLYVVVDLFTNMDDFTGRNLVESLQRIGAYYGYRLPQIFDRLVEAIILLAAMFTVAWMQRNNEQLPLLSAGVSTRRIVLPVLFAACLMLSLATLNQELVLPYVASKLNNPKDDPEGLKDTLVQSAFDANGVHLTGKLANAHKRTVYQLCATIPENVTGNLVHLIADEGRYTQTGPRQGVWELTNTQPAEIDLPDNNSVVEVVDKGRYRIKVRDVTFDALTRRSNWYVWASTSRIWEELSRADGNRQLGMAVIFHQRLARPLVGILLVVLGISMILRDQNRNVILSVGGCLGLCGTFFVVIQTCRTLGENDLLSPVLAAWVPILLFAPFAIPLFDAVHT